MILSFFALFLSFVFGIVLFFFLLPLLSRGFVDLPNARSSHIRPTPRGGGLVFVIISILSSCFFLLVSLSANDPIVLLPLVALPLAFVGLLDDRYNLSAGIRFGVQIFTALLFLLLSPLPFFWIFAPLLLFSICAVINFTNFMDGLDGLVAGCMSVAFTAFAMSFDSPWPLWALLGSLFSFLFCNWSPAKVFMGDVGSTFLGAVYAGLVLQAPSWPEACGYLLIVTPLLGDACFCVVRRLFAGQRIFQAHRLHLFQRLHQAGWPHARVSLTYISATTLLALAMFTGGLPLELSLAVAVMLLGVWLDQRVAVPFAVSSTS